MRLVLAAVAGLLLSGQGAFAQTACADGHVVVVRVSKIKPGQTDLFAKAVSDQQAWYRSHGVTTNQQMFGPVVGKTDEMVTVHMDAPANRGAPDEAWNTFVKEYRDSSDLVSETRACVRSPK